MRFALRIQANCSANEEACKYEDESGRFYWVLHVHKPFYRGMDANSFCDRSQNPFHLRVKLSRNSESVAVSIRCKLGLHPVIRDADAIEALLNKDSDWHIRASVNNMLHHLGIEAFRAAQYVRGCLMRNFSAEAADQSALIREGLTKHFGEWCDLFEARIKEAQQQGEISDQFAASLLAKFVMNSWEGALLRMRAEKKRCSAIGLQRDCFQEAL